MLSLILCSVVVVHDHSLTDSLTCLAGLSARPLLPTSNGADYTTLIFFSTDINDKNTKALVDNLEETLKRESEPTARHPLTDR